MIRNKFCCLEHIDSDFYYDESIKKLRCTQCNKILIKIPYTEYKNRTEEYTMKKTVLANEAQKLLEVIKVNLEKYSAKEQRRVVGKVYSIYGKEINTDE